MNTIQNVEEIIIKVRRRLKVEVRPHHRVVGYFVLEKPNIGPCQLDKVTLVSEIGTIDPRTFGRGFVKPVGKGVHDARNG